jgi:hypothetical protein
MSAETFRRLLADLVRTALDLGFHPSAVHAELATAGMMLDEPTPDDVEHAALPPW